jgi:hypothetical protein
MAYLPQVHNLGRLRRNRGRFTSGAVRVGFGTRSPSENTHLIDSIKQQKRLSRSFRRFEVRRGYTGYEFLSSGNSSVLPTISRRCLLAHCEMALVPHIAGNAVRP